MSKVFKDKEDTDEWGTEGEDIPSTRDSMSKCSDKDEWQVQVFGGTGVWCGVWGGQLEGGCVLEAVRGVVGKAGWDHTSQAAVQSLS